MVISMLKIRRPLGRLIFNMGIAIPGKTVFLIETAHRYPFKILETGFDNDVMFVMFKTSTHQGTNWLIGGAFVLN